MFILMWIQKRKRDNRHDVHSKTTSGEMPRTEFRSVYMTFVDLTKAFYTVSRDRLWKIMAKFGCPARFMAMLRHFHDGMQARVQNDEPFEVANGVKHGCDMASTLFSMMFSAMLMDAFQDSDTGLHIRCRFDGNIFNLRRWQAKTKMQTDVLDKLLYAYDMDTNAVQGQKCKEPWIKSHNRHHNQHKKKTQRLYTNQHLENRTMNQPSL